MRNPRFILVGLMASVLSLVTMSSCAKFEPEMALADYGYFLPNYCENDQDKSVALESEARNYGKYLTGKGYLGNWTGLLWALMQHYFLWGDYQSAVRVGDRLEGASENVQYPIAKFLIAAGSDSTTKLPSSSWLRHTSFEEVFELESSVLADQLVDGFDGLEDFHEFYDWAPQANSLDVLLILAARLLKGEIEQSEKDMIVETLKFFLAEGERLNLYFEYTNSTNSMPWLTWIQASLMLERYAHQSQMDNLVSVLRTARKHIARRMQEENLKRYWVPCVLDESGVFKAMN